MQKSFFFIILLITLFTFCQSKVFDDRPIRGLEPAAVWRNFYLMTRIPHCSFKEERVRKELIEKFAIENKFHYNVDKKGNAVIHVPATRGYENKPIIILQSHLDMVCEKSSKSNHNFDTDPITLIRGPTKEFIKANETTLGADNGIGVAMSLALATNPNVTHGPLELLFTVEEEVGMGGAQALQPNFVKGKILLNLDTSRDQLVIGCAGGVRVVGAFVPDWVPPNPNFATFKIHIFGLVGGHSGRDIHMGRANAIKLIGRLLFTLIENEIPFELVSMFGGSAPNAIPRETETIIRFDPRLEPTVYNLIKQFLNEILMEYKIVDKEIRVSLKKEMEVQKVFSDKFTKNIIYFLQASPNGVLRMSTEIPDLVETSVNFAVVTTKDDLLEFIFSIRSSLDVSKADVLRRLKSLITLAGGETSTFGNYPGWRPNMDSQVLKIASESYRKLFQRDAVIKATHSGLEPGVIGGIYPGLDMISFGPTLHDHHSPMERVEIKSVENVYKLLIEIVERYAKN